MVGNFYNQHEYLINHELYNELEQIYSSNPLNITAILYHESQDWGLSLGAERRNDGNSTPSIERIPRLAGYCDFNSAEAPRVVNVIRRVQNSQVDTRYK